MKKGRKSGKGGGGWMGILNARPCDMLINASVFCMKVPSKLDGTSDRYILDAWTSTQEAGRN